MAVRGRVVSDRCGTPRQPGRPRRQVFWVGGCVLEGQSRGRRGAAYACVCSATTAMWGGAGGERPGDRRACASVGLWLCARVAPSAARVTQRSLFRPLALDFEEPRKR
eukprot:1965193-Prymnesium_polylepis.2